MALLYQTDMIGFVIYKFAIMRIFMWIFWYSLRIIKLSNIYDCGGIDVTNS